MTRVLMLAQKPQRRGAETFARDLAGQLRALDHDCRVLYLYPYEGDTPLPVEADDRVLGGDPSHRAERSLALHPGLLRRLVRAIDEIGPQIVQANGARTVKYGAACRALRGRANWRLVYRNIGDPDRWVRGARRRFLYRRFVMPRVDGIVGVSRATLDAVRSRYELDVPTRAIPRAVVPASLVAQRDRDTVRAELASPGDAPIIAYVGSLTREKRVDRLVRAVADAQKHVTGARLWIVGDGPLRDELERLAVDLEVSASTLFVGAREDPATFILAADVLALSSDTEGIPGAALEAGWLRRPVVATDVGGVAECIEHGVTGTLVQPGDHDALTAALVDLLNDGALRSRLGDAAHDRIASRFTMATVAREYLDFYDEVLAS